MYGAKLRLFFLFLLLISLGTVSKEIGAQEIDNQPIEDWKERAQVLTAVIRGSSPGAGSAVTDILSVIPRHRFLSGAYSAIAYEDIPLPGFDNRIVPSPSDLVNAINLLSPAENESVLVAGNNAGYAAAMLSQISDTVYLIEESSAADSYRNIFSELELNNIIVADRADINAFAGTLSFDNILIHAAVPEISEKITEMLSIKGSIVFPLADKGGFQQLVLLRRSLLGDFIRTGGSCFFPEVRDLKIGN
mgnify:CR=1 FL=1